MRSLLMLATLGLTAISGSVLAQGDQADHNPLAQLDSDGDGSVSFAEFQQGDNRRFSHADADGNGLLSLEEMLAARPAEGPRDREINAQRLERMQARMQARVEKQFLEMDADGDGLVSELEMQEYGFLRLDRDNNGLISAGELRPPRRGAPDFGGRRGTGPKSGQAGHGNGRRGESGDQ